MRFRIADNADNLTPFGSGSADVEPNLFPERLLVLKVAMHKLLADQHDVWRTRIVPLCEYSPSQQRDARRPKEFRGNHQVESVGSLVRGQFRLALQQKSNFPRSRGGQIRGSGPRLHARNPLEPPQNISDK